MPDPLHGLNLFLVALQRFFERRHQSFNRFFARFKITFGLRLDLFKGLSKEDQEILLKAAEDATAHSAEIGARKRAYFMNPEKQKEFQIFFLDDPDKTLLKKVCGEIKADVVKNLPPLGKQLAADLETIQ